MRKYTNNLVNNLIGKHNFRAYFERYRLEKWRSQDAFLQLVKKTLEFGEVKDMRPETLGKIMCSFEVGDVMAVHPGKEVTFAGDCERMLRELAAVCLAHAIEGKLSGNCGEKLWREVEDMRFRLNLSGCGLCA